MTEQSKFAIVVVCTGNVCRSPMAEALLRHDLDVRGIVADVSSVGTLDLSSGADPLAVRALAERGLDISMHQSRMMREENLSDADFVLCMAREHVRAVALLNPSIYPRTFTLRELVRRAQAAGGPEKGQPIWQWSVELSADRQFADMLGDSPLDDIEDPIGQSAEFFREIASQIAELTSALAVIIASGRSFDTDQRR
jgi:protein-tyrosine phosphatase